MNWRFEGAIRWKLKPSWIGCRSLVPLYIELKGDAFIRNPHLKDDEADLAGIDQLLAMNTTERLQRHESWRQFIRLCEHRGWTPEMIAAVVWGDAPADESR